MKKIATIHTDFPTKFGLPRQSGLVDGIKGQIIFEQEFRNREAFRGLEAFSQMIKDMFFDGKLNFNDQIYITNIRHKTAIQEAKESLQMVLQSIEDEMPEDFFSIDLMNAYEVLGSIIGESVGEDLVNTIFSDFCMGK